MITRIISMFSGGFMKWAVFGLLLSIAYGAGNLHATQRAKEEQAALLLAESAKRQAENHLQLVAWTNQVRETLRAEMARQKAADKAAYAVLEQGKAQSDQAAERARASLRIALGEKQKLEMTNEGLKAVAEIQAAEARRPPDAGCVLNNGVRRAVNTYIALLNASPNVGGPEASAPGASSRPTGEDSPVTCVELADSVIDILQVAGGYISRDASWRSWASEALR